MSKSQYGPVRAFDVGGLHGVRVGPGCVRYDLPGVVGSRAWIVDIDPGCQWPAVDEHDAMGEVVYVVSGQLIEDNDVYEPGTCLVYAPDSRHRPRSTKGVRLFGFNPLADSAS